MNKKDIPVIQYEPIIVLDWCTNTVWRGQIPVNLQSSEIEEWLINKGIRTSQCHWMTGNFTYEDIN